MDDMWKYFLKLTSLGWILSELIERSGGLPDDPWFGWNITYNDSWVQGLSYLGNLCSWTIH
jgi:hypothetical protein